MQDLNKIRIRSDDELKMQNVGLKELSQILNSRKVKHFITGGTLLGAIREKNFIKWDWDVEITILTDQIFNIKDDLSNLFDKQYDLFFLGNLYQTVSDPKKYLEFCYGDWQTPKRTSDKREYLTSEHVPKLKIHNIFFQKLKNIFNK
jgi:hypothetical protein